MTPVHGILSLDVHFVVTGMMCEVPQEPELEPDICYVISKKGRIHSTFVLKQKKTEFLQYRTSCNTDVAVSRLIVFRCSHLLWKTMGCHIVNLPEVMAQRMPVMTRRAHPSPRLGKQTPEEGPSCEKLMCLSCVRRWPLPAAGEDACAP